MRRRALQVGDRHAGIGRHLRRGDVDRVERGHPGEAHDDLAVERHAPADEPGVAALGHERDTCRAADAHDGRDLLGGAGPHDGRGGAVEAAGPVGDVARHHVGLGEHVPGADDRLELGADGGGQSDRHTRAVAAHRTIIPHRSSSADGSGVVSGGRGASLVWGILRMRTGVPRLGTYTGKAPKR